MISKNERFLAALIFVLWSFWVVVLPVFGRAEIFDLANGVPASVLWSYLLLHAVILTYVVQSLARLLLRRKTNKYHWYLVLIYLYVCATLGISMYFISQGL